MNHPQTDYLILCKYFVYFGIRFELDLNWPIRIISILSSCTYNLFRANRLLALYLSIEKTNYLIRIVELLQLGLEIWLYFYLLFNQELISDHMNNIISSLSKHSRIQFLNKLKLYRLIYLIFLIEILRLIILWLLAGTDNIYSEEYPFINQTTIEEYLGYKHILCKFFVFIALFNKLLSTMLICITIFLYLFIYYANHLNAQHLSEQSEQYTINLIDLKSKYRQYQKQSKDSNNIFGILPFIWYLHLLFISTVRIVNLLDNTTDSNPPLLVSLLIKGTLIISVSLYLANIQTIDDYHVQNINQKLIDRIYSSTNYFQTSALLLEILIHPLQPPIVWSIYLLNRAFLFRFVFVLIAIVIICSQYAVYHSTSKISSKNEVPGLTPF